MPPSVVLVTGAGRFLGGHLAARLAADPDIHRVLAVDTAPPPRDLARRMGRVEFVRVDIRNPLIGKVIAQAGVDTVVHAAPAADAGSSGGTRRFLAACQQARSITRLVVASTSAVYGSSSRDPAIVDESMAPRGPLRGGPAKDAAEIEGDLRGFAGHRPDVTVTVLRFSNVIGPRIDTAFTRYLALPVVPTVLGFDARVQLLHEQDALAVLERAAVAGPPGVFNVAADGVLLLSQAIRRAGRLPVPVPPFAVGTVGRVLRTAGLADFSPEQLRLLDFGRVLDHTKLRAQFGFSPRWTTTQAFDDYVRGRALHRLLDPAGLAAVERGLLAAARALR